MEIVDLTLVVAVVAGAFAVSVFLAFWAVFFLGGYVSVWLPTIFFGLLYVLNRQAVEEFMTRWAGRAASVFTAARELVFGFVVLVIVGHFLTVVSGVTMGAAGRGERLGAFFWLSLLGLFAARQAGWVRGEGGRRWAVGFFVLLFVYALGWAFLPSLPKLAEAARTGLDSRLNDLAEGKWPTPSALPTMASVCPGASNVGFDREKTLRLDLQEGCWSGWVITPPGTNYRIDPPENGWVEARFLDGSVYRLESGKPVDLGLRRGIFRLRASGGAVVSIGPQA